MTMENTPTVHENNKELLNKIMNYKTRLANHVTFSSLILNNRRKFKKLTLHVSNYRSTLTINNDRMLLRFSDLRDDEVLFEWQQSDIIQPPNPDCILMCDNNKMSVMAIELEFLTFYDCFQAFLNVSMKISDNEEITEIID